MAEDFSWFSFALGGVSGLIIGIVGTYVGTYLADKRTDSRRILEDKRDQDAKFREAVARAPAITSEIQNQLKKTPACRTVLVTGFHSRNADLPFFTIDQCNAATVEVGYLKSVALLKESNQHAYGMLYELNDEFAGWLAVRTS